LLFARSSFARFGVQRIVHLVSPPRGSTAVVLIVVAATFVSSCETSSTVSTSPNPVKCRVSLASPPMVGADGGAGSLAIATQPECAWDAASNVGWIASVSPASGQGAAEVSFRVMPNDGSSSRDGAIVVNGEQARVSQRAPCRYDVTPVSQSIGMNGGTGNVTVSTGAECAWTALVDGNWISLTSAAAGSGNGTIAFAVPRNESGGRTGSIRIGSQQSVVTQAASPPPPPPDPPVPPPPAPPVCTYSISPTNDSVRFNEGVGSVSVSTTPGCTWTATTTSWWLTVESGTRTGNGTVSYRFPLNLGTTRTTTATIAGHTFTVIQDAPGGLALLVFESLVHGNHRKAVWPQE
jgi:hypothetical protein